MLKVVGGGETVNINNKNPISGSRNVKDLRVNHARIRRLRSNYRSDSGVR